RHLAESHILPRPNFSYEYPFKQKTGMRKIIFFYKENCSKSLEIKKHLQENFSASHDIRPAPSVPGTTSYFRKHEIKKLPTVLLLNEKDRELRRIEKPDMEQLTEFIDEKRKIN